MTSPLPLMLAAALAAALPAPTLVSDDVLEPSVENEVWHACDRARARRPLPPPVSSNALTTLQRSLEGLNATDRALRLVSTQRPDGRWLMGTNDVTRAVLECLDALLGR